MQDESRDLPEDRGGELPAHIRIRSFKFEGTDLVAALWIGNENSGSEVDVLLRRSDVEWMIGTLRRCSKPQD